LARSKVYLLYIETLPNERNAAIVFLGPPLKYEQGGSRWCVCKAHEAGRNEVFFSFQPQTHRAVPGRLEQGARGGQERGVLVVHRVPAWRSATQLSSFWNRPSITYLPFLL
jgi:hypothetical protein